MFVTRYTNDGTPEWITTLGGPSTIVGPSTIIGIPGQNRLATTNLMKTAIDSQNNLFIVGTYNSNALFLRNKFRDIVTSISSPRSNSDVFLAKFQADGSTGALARLGSISTVNSFVTSNWNCLIDTNDSICISGMYSSQYFGFYPSSNPSVPSVSTFIRNASINGNQSHYCARIGNGLSSIAIGRLQLSTVAGQTVSPFYLNIDSSNNLYTCTQINPRSTLQFYTLGNHTTTPNSEIIPQALTNQPTNSVVAFVSKFTSNIATSWVIQQSSGQAPTSTTINNSIIGNTIAPFTNLYGSLYIDSNQRVYTSFWSSTIRSTILYDKNLSSITIPQQITGNIIGISTIFVLASYASDGINRPQ
jgi:hypothetical protein